MSRTHSHDLNDNRADDENSGEYDVHGILVHHHIRQKYSLSEDET